jgi:hypothetical protein
VVSVQYIGYSFPHTLHGGTQCEKVPAILPPEKKTRVHGVSALKYLFSSSFALSRSPCNFYVANTCNTPLHATESSSSSLSARTRLVLLPAHRHVLYTFVLSRRAYLIHIPQLLLTIQDLPGSSNKTTCSPICPLSSPSYKYSLSYSLVKMEVVMSLPLDHLVQYLSHNLNFSLHLA